MYADQFHDEDIFGRIVAGKAPSAKVFEDDVAVAFLDIFPQGRGHTLVVPKQSAASSFLEMKPRDVGPFIERVHLVARAIAKTLCADGLELQQFNGAAAGQTVARMHFHVLPRWHGVSLMAHGSASRASDEELQKLAAQLWLGVEREVLDCSSRNHS